MTIRSYLNIAFCVFSAASAAAQTPPPETAAPTPPAGPTTADTPIADQPTTETPTTGAPIPEPPPPAISDAAEQLKNAAAQLAGGAEADLAAAAASLEAAAKALEAMAARRNEAPPATPVPPQVEPAPVPGPSPMQILRDVIDTRITFTFADDDLVRGPEDTLTGGRGANGSPSLPTSVPSNDNRLFFDDFERRDTGFENLTHLVVYAREPGFLAGVDTEAALVMRMEILAEKGYVNVTEDGSYLKISIDLFDDYRLGLTAFPVNANRFKLGYSYDISWGGSDIFADKEQRRVMANPGLRLDFTSDIFSVFLGWKSALVQMTKGDGSTETDVAWGILAGAHADIVDELRLEANGGFFHRGTIDKQELEIPDGQGRYFIPPWQGYGGSAQITYHIGMPIGTPIDFRLYKNDPLLQQSLFTKEEYGEGVSFVAQSEISVLGQTLQDIERQTTTTNQLAIAFDLSGKIKIDKARIHGLFVYRDLAFILFNMPSDPTFSTFPDGTLTSPEVFFSLGADYCFESLHLTPGLILGLQLPASKTGTVSAGSNPPAGLGQQTQVFRSATERDILDPGDAVQPVFASKLTARFDLSEMLAALGEFQLSYDPNRRMFLQDPSGIGTYAPGEPLILGFNLMLQAMF